MKIPATLDFALKTGVSVAPVRWYSRQAVTA